MTKEQAYPSTTPPPPPSLSSSSQVSQNGDMEKGSTEEELVNPTIGQLPVSTDIQ